ncbi:MAG: DUF4952 domain-containing protein [Desulfuromonadales bacterium]|nr:DUF4952 domain-containing protein [Desulfuromonadales bacterium]
MAKELECGDFLAMINKKPVALEFLGCKKDKDAQLSVLRATYRVTGAKAGEVEAWLRKESGMAPLVFNCCGWEPKMAGYGYLPNQQWPNSHDPTLTNYQISMASGETLYSEREEWPLINWFYVDVELFLETP